jgi:hypothetical protein
MGRVIAVGRSGWIPGDDPQVAGDRRLAGEQRQNLLVHLEVAAVDAVVVGDHHAGELDVLVGQ